MFLVTSISAVPVKVSNFINYKHVIEVSWYIDLI